MFNKITLKPHFAKCCTSYKLDDKSIPQQLFNATPVKPDLSGFKYPLPSNKKDYTCYIKTGDIEWFGASTGLTRYDPNAEYRFNKIIYYSAERDLRDNNVKALYAENDTVWVLTDTAATKIENKLFTGEEISDILLDETLTYVMRRGMVSQKHLKEAWNLESQYPYDNSDNDGGFTANFCVGEIFRYATLKREKGINAPETIKAKEVATKSIEAVLLLWYIHGRGNGFIARTYCCPDEPVPDDGIFFKRVGNKAICADTSASRQRGVAGLEIDCSAPIPERLRKRLTDEGYTEEGVIYKADTSSDEVTLEMIMLLFAHKYLACDDKELDDLIKVSIARNVDFIIDSGLFFADYSGASTTWGKWNEEYFLTPDGWVDGALNSAELLFYLLVAEDVCGDSKYRDYYNYLINERGYGDMTIKHIDRLTQFCIATESDPVENIMYGDHALATASFFGLCWLEKDEKLRSQWKKGFDTWMNTTIGREYNPGYTFLYLIACPEESTNEYEIEKWFLRSNISRLAAASTVVGRHDLPVSKKKQGYLDMPVNLPPDERFISKYDRDPFEYKDSDSGGKYCIESCYYYNYAYWVGRFFGFINGEEK